MKWNKIFAFVLAAALLALTLTACGSQRDRKSVV